MDPQKLFPAPQLNTEPRGALELIILGERRVRTSDTDPVSSTSDPKSFSIALNSLAVARRAMDMLYKNITLRYKRRYKILSDYFLLKIGIPRAAIQFPSQLLVGACACAGFFDKIPCRFAVRFRMDDKDFICKEFLKITLFRIVS